MTRPTTTTTPDRGAGHYAEDGSAWYDERRERWYHLLAEQESVEIQLEEVGGTAWWKRILTTLFSPNGQQQLRFVARPRPGRGDEQPIAVGGTFSCPRWIVDAPPEPAWAPEMGTGLADVRGDLERTGWLLEGRGDEAWSYRYVRPRVDSSREYLGPTAAPRGAQEDGEEGPPRDGAAEGSPTRRQDHQIESPRITTSEPPSMKTT